jgi:DNA polymerase-3 subunit epsilon
MFKFLRKNNKVLPDFWNSYVATLAIPTTQELDKISFVVLDTETTGFDYEKDRMLCIGALKLVNQKIEIKKGFEIYIHQDVYRKESAKIHGILKNEAVTKVSELEALKVFLNYLGNNVIVAHHAYFDITMINRALARHGMPPLKNKNIDTSNLYKKTLIKSNLITRKSQYSLDELADKYNISKKDRHTAIGDAYITAILFLKILTKLKDKKGIRLKDLFN